MIIIFYKKDKYIPLKIVRDFAGEFYEKFLIPIPKEQIFNMIDYLYYNKIPIIKKSFFFSNSLGESEELIDIDTTEFVQNYVNYNFTKKGNRFIWLNNHSEFCYCLTEFLMNFINVEKGGNLTISYENNNLNKTIMKEMIFKEENLFFKEDSDNNLSKPQTKIIESLLQGNKDLLDISNNEILISKSEFLNILSQLPLFSFTLANSLKNIDESKKMKHKKKGIFIQICIDQSEILRLKVTETNEVESSQANEINSNENEEIVNFFFIYIIYFDKREEIILKEWDKFSGILVDYLNKNKELQKERDNIIEKLLHNPVLEIETSINSYDEKFYTFMKGCIMKFIKHMNQEIDIHLNRNESPIQMDNLHLLEIYSNFKNVDFHMNEFSAFLCFQKVKKEMDYKLSLNQNIRALSQDYYVNTTNFIKLNFL